MATSGALVTGGGVGLGSDREKGQDERPVVANGPAEIDER
jgi:hypothetical protein